VLIGKAFDLQKAVTADFAATVDAVAAAIYLVDAKGRIVHANRSGLALLAADDVLHGANGRLRARDPAFEQTLGDLLADAAGGDDLAIGTRGTAIHLASRGGDHHVAHVLPLTAGERRGAAAPHRAVAAVFVHKAAQSLASPPEVLAKAYRLTPRELGVLFAVVEAGGVGDVAALLGLSQATVKTHLRQVFAKTGVARQAELVRLVAGFLSPAGRPQ
jgi:DNA-binding CsgD family transcriptional regulator